MARGLEKWITFQNLP